MAKASNVGVAAHITAASVGGPRYDESLIDRQRRAAANGIWLCQNCAKLIDNDAERFTVALLFSWKDQAEKEALARIGKTNAKLNSSPLKAERDLKRDHKVRDELSAAFLKPISERLAQPRGKAQYEKFKFGEFIVHRLGETTYPGFDSTTGISNWFKLEMFDLYFNGIEGVLNIQYILASDFTKSWSLLPEERKNETFPDGFWPVKVFKTGRIPWKFIRHYDLEGDEYYRSPHLYCLYAHNGMPYEDFAYYTISEDHGYHFPLNTDGLIDIDRLLSIDALTGDEFDYLK